MHQPSADIHKCTSLVVQALLEAVTKCQAPKVARQDRVVQALLEAVSKGQALRVAWQSRVLQAPNAKL